MALQASDAASTDYVRSTTRPCPHCGKPLERIHRRLLDRIISLVRPVQRYHCRNFSCRWEGRLPIAQRDAEPSSIQ